jgi:hypothetical protein
VRACVAFCLWVAGHTTPAPLFMQRTARIQGNRNKCKPRKVSNVHPAWCVLAVVDRKTPQRPCFCSAESTGEHFFVVASKPASHRGRQAGNQLNKNTPTGTPRNLGRKYGLATTGAHQSQSVTLSRFHLFLSRHVATIVSSTKRPDRHYK